MGRYWLISFNIAQYWIYAHLSKIAGSFCRPESGELCHFQYVTNNIQYLTAYNVQRPGGMYDQILCTGPCIHTALFRDIVQQPTQICNIDYMYCVSADLQCTTHIVHRPVRVCDIDYTYYASADM